MKIRISKRKIHSNILNVWSQCSEADKYEWYTEANQFARTLVSSEISLVQVCGIIASLSPLKSWSDNKRISALLIKDKVKSGIHTQLCTLKALEIQKNGTTEQIVLDVLRGEKISSFFLNILHPSKSTHVTIDRHAFAIAIGRHLKDEETALTKVQYVFIKQCYVDVAKKLKVSPVLLQSATWVKWKQIKTIPSK